MPITTALYELIAGPHRDLMDLFADPAGRGEISPFIQLLWRKGAAHEYGIVRGGGSAARVDGRFAASK